MQKQQPVPQQPARQRRAADHALDRLPDRAEGLDVRPRDLLPAVLRHHPRLQPHRDHQQLPHPVHLRPGRRLQRQVGPGESSCRCVFQVNRVNSKYEISMYIKSWNGVKYLIENVFVCESASIKVVMSVSQSVSLVISSVSLLVLKY